MKHISLIIFSFLILNGCSSYANISHENVYFVNDSNLHYKKNGPFLIHEFTMNRLLRNDIVKGTPIAILYVSPEPKGRVKGESGELYLVNTESCKKSKNERCLTKLNYNKNINEYKEKNKKYHYLAIYRTIHPIDPNSDEGAINILKDQYEEIQLFIGAASMPFFSLKTEKLTLTRDKVLELWRKSKNKDLNAKNR